MANTMTLIQSVTVPSGGSASITFSSIPATYTDLVLKASMRGDAAQILLKVQPNGDTTGLSRRSLYTDNGTGAYSGSASDSFAAFINSSAYTASTFSNMEIYFPNYSGSAAKSYSVDMVGENNATTTIMGMIAGLDTTTAAISSIVLTPNSGNIAQFSTAYLYGIKNS